MKCKEMMKSAGKGWLEDIFPDLFREEELKGREMHLLGEQLMCHRDIGFTGSLYSLFSWYGSGFLW